MTISKQAEDEQKIEARNTLDYIESNAKAIISEIKKWRKSHPSAVFHHGYAHEKALKILEQLDKGRMMYRY